MAYFDRLVAFPLLRRIESSKEQAVLLAAMTAHAVRIKSIAFIMRNDYNDVMYSIKYEKKAATKLRKIPANQRKLIIAKLADYAASPVLSNQVKRLVGRDAYRMRVADWRIIFEKHDGKLLVLVLEIGARGGIYK